MTCEKFIDSSGREVWLCWNCFRIHLSQKGAEKCPDVDWDRIEEYKELPIMEKKKKKKEDDIKVRGNNKEFNFVLRMGEGDGHIDFQYSVRKTLKNRLKYWLFCRFFPFRIERWEDYKDE